MDELDKEAMEKIRQDALAKLREADAMHLPPEVKTFLARIANNPPWVLKEKRERLGMRRIGFLIRRMQILEVLIDEVADRRIKAAMAHLFTYGSVQYPSPDTSHTVIRPYRPKLP